MELISLSWTQDQFLLILYFLGSPFSPGEVPRFLEIQ